MNLFQPDVEVIKTGPAAAFVGQTVTYNFTINNLSSNDAPDLILDSVIDDVIGNITAQAPPILPAHGKGETHNGAEFQVCVCVSAFTAENGHWRLGPLGDTLSDWPPPSVGGGGMWEGG